MKIELNLINESHVGEKYVDWLNDYDVVRYTEQRFTHHKESEIKSYVKHILSSESEFLYGIFHEGIHIGNIKIGPINTQHQVADMGYIIGEKAYWGKGIMTEAIRIASGYCKEIYKLKKITAGVYENNKASIKVLQNNGFKQEGILISQVDFEGDRINVLLFGKLL